MHFIIPVIFHLCLTGVDTANILFLYFPTFSHIRGPLHVATDLASHGHVVWNALSTRLASDKRLQAPGVHILPYKAVDHLDIEQTITDSLIDAYFKGTGAPISFDEFVSIQDLILRDTDLIDNIRKLKFDLIVFDALPIARMLTVIAYKLDIPFIYMGAAFDPHVSRTPYVLSAFPFPVLPWTPAMDFGTRILNTIILFTYYFYDPMVNPRAVATYVPEKPYITLESFTHKALLWIIDFEPFLHYSQATVPNVKFVGSLSASEPRPLPKVYKTFMDEAIGGVVIVSFGSNVQKLPDEIYDRLIDAFSRTKYKFIFRSHKKVSSNRNIMLTDWMPQADLLAHPNAKLFITHCGQNGQNEAFLNGVPMIGFPIFAEQPFNAVRLVYMGFGLHMDLLTFTANELTANINEVIQNTSYSKKIKKAAEVTKLRQRTPKDEAVYWIEHVLQYGGEHLRSYCQDMPLYQYLNLDVIGLLVFIFHISVFLIWKSCRFCIRKICGKSKQKIE